jgi:hypothetical protein
MQPNFSKKLFLVVIFYLIKGATDKKEEDNEPQCIEIQGYYLNNFSSRDVRDRIFDYLIDEFKIPIDKIYTKEDINKEKKLYKK